MIGINRTCLIKRLITLQAISEMLVRIKKNNFSCYGCNSYSKTRVYIVCDFVFWVISLGVPSLSIGSHFIPKHYSS